MALRSVTVVFEHHSPGDIEGQVTYTDTVGDTCHRVFNASNEHEIMQDVAHNTRAMSKWLMEHEGLPPSQSDAVFA
jgi:hypothetical protein